MPPLRYLLLALFLAAPSTHASFEKKLSAFKEKIKGRSVEMTGNLLSTGTSDGAEMQDIVAGSIGYNYVGVAVQIKNHSPYDLTAPLMHAASGWQEDGSNLPGYGLNSVDSGKEDAFLAHNRGYTTGDGRRNSRGAFYLRT